jgi:hypothetical protein
LFFFVLKHLALLFSTSLVSFPTWVLLWIIEMVGSLPRKSLLIPILWPTFSKIHVLMIKVALEWNMLIV